MLLNGTGLTVLIIMNHGERFLNNLLNLPKNIDEMTDSELEEERIRLLTNVDTELYNERRYYQLVHEIVRRMFLYGL